MNRFSDAALRKVIETDYLNCDNTYRYRGIVRVMYRAYEKMKYSIYRQDILYALSQYEQFEDYTDEMLKADLVVLVDKGNIFERADASRAKTPEEFINKVFLYQLSPSTIEIERMLIKLEIVNTGAAQKSSLESSFIEEFKTVLMRINRINLSDNKTCYEWWSALSDNFKKFSENYKDYISDFYSPKTGELIKTSEFLIFKERFIIYLRNFISQIQNHSIEIGSFIEKIDSRFVKEIIAASAEHEASIPQMNFVFNRSEYIELNIGKYETMREWFLLSGGRPPLYEQLIDHTNEVIRKITRIALQIIDKRNMGVNRKNDYFSLLKMFSKCDNINEAHKIAALTFGVSGIRHIIADEYRESDSINSSVYDEKPKKVSIKPGTTYKEKLNKSKIPNYTAEKQKRMHELLEKQKEDERQIRKLIINNRIDMKHLPEISAAQRMTILSWFSRKIKEEDGTYVGETGFGAKFRIKQAEAGVEIKISCEDGDFYMPYYIIEIEDELIGQP